MAKPTKNAMPITLGLGFLAVLGVIIGLIIDSALVPLILILPVGAYEVYRVEGESTRYASWGLMAAIIAEIAFIVFDISYDLGKLIDTDTTYIQNYEVPLADIKTMAPILMGVLSVVLFKNTYGKYTKLLSVFILITAFALVYIINPEIFNQIAELAAQEGIDRL